MNLLPEHLLTEEPTPEPTPTPTPESTDSANSNDTNSDSASSGDSPNDSANSPTNDEQSASPSDPWTPQDTACGTMQTTQDVCLHLTPDAGTFFGTSCLLVVLVLCALLASQLRRP